MKELIEYSTLDSLLKKKNLPWWNSATNDGEADGFLCLWWVSRARKCLLLPGYKILSNFMKTVWQSRDDPGASPDSTTNLPVSKGEFLNLWALVSAFETWDPSSYVLSIFREGNDLHSPKWCCISPHQILLLLITLHGCSSLSLLLLVMFGTLHSWPSPWSVCCLVKAVVKSQGLFNRGLILLAMTSLIMDLAG